MAKKSTSKKPAANLFGDLKGEKFGGNNNRLIMEENSVVKGVTFAGMEKNVDLGQGPIDLYTGKLEGTTDAIRLPAAAIFRKNMEKAALKPGSVIAIARLPDAIKQKGKGKGKPMEVYEVLVTKRK